MSNNNKAPYGGRRRQKKSAIDKDTKDTETRNFKNEKYNRPARPIGYLALEAAISTMDHSRLVIELSSNTFGFLTLLQQRTIQPGMMCLVLSALSKAVDCPADSESRKMVLYLLMKILPKNKSDDNFMTKVLPIFVMNLQKYTSPNYHERENFVRAILDLLKFIQRVQLVMPQGSRDAFSDLVPGIQAQIEFINRKGRCFSNETMELLADVGDAIEKFNEKEPDGANVEFEVLNEPPEDFRSIQICPSAEDILFNHEPFIRKNIVDGKYVGGVDHYLDVQFRLLREDFVRPLRDGIREYLRLTQEKTKKQDVVINRINDINLYNQVHVISSVINHGDLVYNAKFDTTNFKKVRWQVSFTLGNCVNGILVTYKSDLFVQ